MRVLTGMVLSCTAALCLASCSRPDAAERGVTAGGSPPVSKPASGRFTWPDGIRAAVSLTFDDARPSQVDVGMPLLNAYGVRATFYVSPGRIEERRDEWIAAIAAGHEIGNHSMRHPCTGNFPWARHKALEDYTLAEMAAELDEASAEIRRTLGVEASTYAYPCGQKYVGRGGETRSYVPLVASRFLAGRGWRDEGPNDPSFCDLAQLMAVELDGLTFEQLKALVDDAMENRFWLVLCGHDIGAGGRQTTRADTLRAFCEYVRADGNGLWVDTVAEIARHVAKR